MNSSTSYDVYLLEQAVRDLAEHSTDELRAEKKAIVIVHDMLQDIIKRLKDREAA